MNTLANDPNNDADYSADSPDLVEAELLQDEPEPISQVPLLIIGLLWLMLAGAIIVYEFARPAQIEIEWTTETEFDTAGFNIYRSTAVDGPYERINPQLIPSQAEAAAGAVYVFVDDAIDPGQTYYYVLEDVEYSGVLQRHDDERISGQFVRLEWWALVSVPVSVLVGMVLLTTSLRKEPS